MADGGSVKGPRHEGRNSDVYAYVDVRRWRLFVLARERKCDAFTSRQRTSSPGKLQDHWMKHEDVQNGNALSSLLFFL